MYYLSKSRPSIKNGRSRFSLSTTIGFQGFGSTYQSYFDGVMSHVHYVDGTQYAASDFVLQIAQLENGKLILPSKCNLWK